MDDNHQEQDSAPSKRGTLPSRRTTLPSRRSEERLGGQDEPQQVETTEVVKTITNIKDGYKTSYKNKKQEKKKLATIAVSGAAVIMILLVTVFFVIPNVLQKNGDGTVNVDPVEQESEDVSILVRQQEEAKQGSEYPLVDDYPQLSDVDNINVANHFDVTGDRHVVLGANGEYSLSLGYDMTLEAVSDMPESQHDCSTVEILDICHLADAYYRGAKLEVFAMQSAVRNPILSYPPEYKKLRVPGAYGAMTSYQKTDGEYAKGIIVAYDNGAGLLITVPQSYKELDISTMALSLTAES